MKKKNNFYWFWLWFGIELVWSCTLIATQNTFAHANCSCCRAQHEKWWFLHSRSPCTANYLWKTKKKTKNTIEISKSGKSWKNNLVNWWSFSHFTHEYWTFLVIRTCFLFSIEILFAISSFICYFWHFKWKKKLNFRSRWMKFANGENECFVYIRFCQIRNRKWEVEWP